MLGESVVPEHDIQDPGRFAEAQDAGDILRRERPGRVDDECARAQAHDGYHAPQISAKEPERVGEHPKIFSQLFHERRRI